MRIFFCMFCFCFVFIDFILIVLMSLKCKFIKAKNIAILYGWWVFDGVCINIRLVYVLICTSVVYIYVLYIQWMLLYSAAWLCIHMDGYNCIRISVCLCVCVSSLSLSLSPSQYVVYAVIIYYFNKIVEEKNNANIVIKNGACLMKCYYCCYCWRSTTVCMYVCMCLSVRIIDRIYI